MLVNAPNKSPRGAFIVLEGVDRCGKTTQVGLLAQSLKKKLGLAAVLCLNFPNRTTMVGQLIDQYLKSKQELDDRAIHLLFSANRWEVAPKLTSTLLQEGTTVVCDRYAYSGVAFSSAKDSLKDCLDWCQSCDVGLPAPDAVIFLDLTQEQAEQRGGYGDERYEKREMQTKVRQRFSELQAQDERDGTVPWFLIDAAQSVEEVHDDIYTIVQETIQQVQEQDKPLGLLWKQEPQQQQQQQEKEEDGNSENRPSN